MTLFMNNFIHLWIMMEINTLMLISLMALKSKSFKATFNFFVIQSISSLMLIVLFIVMNNFYSYSMFNFIMAMTFMLKLGMFPFFFWPPLINKNIDWILIFIMSTSQKLIPLLMINQYINLINNKLFFYLILWSILISSLISTMMNYNELNLKKILTFSSLNHLSWMILILMFDSSMFLTYFLIYSISMIFLCIILNKFDINSLNDFLKIQFFDSKKINFIITFNFLIISALPPFLTFLIKMNSIKILMENYSFSSSLFFLMISIFTLIFYMNIIIKMNMFIMIKMKFFNQFYSNLKLNFFTSIFISFLSSTFLFFLFNSIY
uniref:NADH dehydrogenase subunit 2 n=1 Tax=Vespula rufa TaxID=1895167 RepID=UPI00286B8BB1|nr:NADH dehydrogenase subunit 2 [Vespula rufa]WKC15403.1 NADH dehydrogenase subunit 2 [Vespula rufa]